MPAIRVASARSATRSSNRWSERHRDATLDPTAFADRHLRGRAKGDLVASGLHLDTMKPHARIGHRGAMHLERGLQSSRKREKLGHLPLLRGIPARVEPDGMKRDDQHPADKRGAIIHVPVSVWFREGYGKLFSRPYALPQVMVADNQRPEHADSPIGMNQR